MVKKDGLILENNTIMADKEFLERMLSMLPEEFQDIYDDTIPEAKEIRKKMGEEGFFHKVLFLRYADV